MVDRFSYMWSIWIYSTWEALTHNSEGFKFVPPVAPLKDEGSNLHIDRHVHHRILQGSQASLVQPKSPKNQPYPQILNPKSQIKWASICLPLLSKVLVPVLGYP